MSMLRRVYNYTYSSIYSNINILYNQQEQILDLTDSRTYMP